ncbi:ABC-type phosphate/phosphonate transport system, periplasmic component [Paraburkholderia tropica]|uniref:phosphate/phosphite/phosphonate ABC transporter substrate-binding protein n=1 Tax=Paraburkholderia tropica TaxID=92647 RepID=UPI001CAE4D49|nr:PhnD/SsuA/transferrin family substrate-binding protein [Paraburkholderia tropica]CAG9209919.1 ABC-type phosphate/phosphonate transport system, periplasmic component [Paraburkholderia tropica]
MTHWIAALPMYNVTPQHGTLWRALLRDTLGEFARRAGVRERMTLLDEALGDLFALWRSPDLLMSQTCGFPYRLLGLDKQVHLLATPRFNAPGCEGAFYRSVLVVSAQAYANGATTLAACGGLRAACNSADSHSGMNALRHSVATTVAQSARGARFFASVSFVGSHLNALRALAANEADVAAIDCVTLAYVRDALPDMLESVREIGMTAAAPGLPLIASRTVPDAHAAMLRDALDHACTLDPLRAKTLRLQGFSRLAPADYAIIEQFAGEARAAGYAELA